MLGVTTGSWRMAEYRRLGVDVEFLSLGEDVGLVTRLNEERPGFVLLGMCEVEGRRGLLRGIGGAFEGISILFRGIARA